MTLPDAMVLALFQGLYAKLEELQMSQTAGQQAMDAAFARLDQEITEITNLLQQVQADLAARGDDVDPQTVADRLQPLVDRLNALTPVAPPAPPAPPPA